MYNFVQILEKAELGKKAAKMNVAVWDLSPLYFDLSPLFNAFTPGNFNCPTAISISPKAYPATSDTPH